MNRDYSYDRNIVLLAFVGYLMSTTGCTRHDAQGRVAALCTVVEENLSRKAKDKPLA